jgi:hypothetical protein
MPLLNHQREFVLESEQDREAESDRQRGLRDDLVMACRAVARELGYDACAAILDRVWGPLGRPVSASALRSALNDTERNHFRFEWVIWFSTASEDVATLLNEIAGKTKPKKTAEQELADLKTEMRRELGKVADKLIRKAETP